MKLEDIKTIVNSSLPNETQESLIINVISKDSKVIPILLKILEEERREKKELILDSNLELSRALVTLTANNYGRQKKNRDFITEEIKKHYLKWKDVIKCCFNIEGLP